MKSNGLLQKVLRFLGAFGYSAIIVYLIWLFWHSIIPWTYSLSWFWIIVGFILFGLVIGLITSVSPILWMPLILLVKRDKWIGILPLLLTLFFGYSSIREVWMLNMHYGFKEVVVGILLTTNIFILYMSLSYTIFMHEKSDKYCNFR